MEENKEKKPLYQCKECGKTVIVYQGKIYRICKHEDAGVVGNMTATVYGIGSTNHNPQKQ